MGSLFRNRAFAVLLLLLVIAVAFGAAHNKAIETRQSFAPKDGARTSIVPVTIVSRAVAGIGDAIVRIGRPRRAILKENAELRQQVRQLTQENARLRECAEENVRLRQTLALRDTMGLQSMVAEVVARQESNWFDTAIIDKGRNSGVEDGSAVVNHRGLIGQVVEAGPFTSQVVAITDQTSKIGAMVQRSRTSGILQGQGGDLLVLAYLPKDADVKKNDVVISSGSGRVIPKGLVVGRVIKVVRNNVGGTTSAFIRPSVRFDQLEQVLVVKPGQGIQE